MLGGAGRWRQEVDTEIWGQEEHARGMGQEVDAGRWRNEVYARGWR